MRYEDIVDWLAWKTGHGLRADEGLRFGVPTSPLERVMVCWMVTMPVLEEAAHWGAQLIMSHEALWHPYYLGRQAVIPEGRMAWKANVARVNILAAHEIAVMRCHGSGDDTDFLSAFLDLLGLEGAFEGRAYHRLCLIEPMPIRELARRVKESLGMEGLRVSARDMDAKASRIGFPYGGLGLQLNMGFLQRMTELGCDCLIAGESDSYAMQFVMDSGMAMIETSHEVSENPGLKRMAEALDAHFDDAEFRYCETKRPFVIL